MLVQVGYHLQTLLQSSFPPVVFEAAKSLLAICRMSQKSAVFQFSVSGSWGPGAFDVLVRLWEQKSGPIGDGHHGQILATLSSAIKCLPVLILALALPSNLCLATASPDIGERRLLGTRKFFISLPSASSRVSQAMGYILRGTSGENLFDLVETDRQQ